MTQVSNPDTRFWERLVVGDVVSHGLEGENRVDVAYPDALPHLRCYRRVIQDGPDATGHQLVNHILCELHGDSNDGNTDFFAATT